MTEPQERPQWPSFRPFIEFVRGARQALGDQAADEFAADLQGSLMAAWEANWRWETALARAVHYVADPNASGRDLLYLVQKNAPKPGDEKASAEVIQQQASWARQAMARRLAQVGQPGQGGAALRTNTKTTPRPWGRPGGSWAGQAAAWRCLREVPITEAVRRLAVSRGIRPCERSSIAFGPISRRRMSGSSSYMRARFAS